MNYATIFIDKPELTQDFFLQSSRRINYKNLMRDCVSLMCRLHSQVHEGFSNSLDCSEGSTKPSFNYDDTVATSSLEFGKSTCIAIQKLLMLVSLWRIPYSSITIFEIVIQWWLLNYGTQIMDLDASRKKADLEGQTTRVDGVR